MSDIVFKNWNAEKSRIAEINKADAILILEEAGIEPAHRQYKQFYRAVLCYIHDSRRFYRYNDKVKQDILKRIQECEGNGELFAKNEIFWKQKLVNLQTIYAKGDYAVPDIYENIKSALNETIASGMRIRKKRHTAFPSEFYDEKGGLQRLVYEIPLQERLSGASALQWAKDKYHIDFKNGRFLLGKDYVRPAAFFQTRAMSLQYRFCEKIQNNPQLLDLQDDELLRIVKNKDYTAFHKLNMQRGADNKQNKVLRNILTDVILFQEFSDILQKGPLTAEYIQEAATNLANIYTQNAQLIKQDSSKGKWGTTIDRIMLTVIPADVAAQSTYKDWKNCMHTTGICYEYVDDSIGVGSIVAFGYNSHNPHKMLSRVIIHPYMKINTQVEDQDVYYCANPRVYGEENSSFNAAVKRIVAHFNKGKNGIFEINHGVNEYECDEGAVYIDSTGGHIVPKVVAVGDINLDDYADEKGCFSFDGVDLSQVTSLKAKDKLKELHFYDTTIPDNFDLSEIPCSSFTGFTNIGKNCRFSQKNILFDAVVKACSDLENMPNLLIENMCEIEAYVKLPPQADLSGLDNITVIKSNIPDGYDFSHGSRSVFKFCELGKNVKTAEYTKFKNMNIASNVNFAKTKELECIDCELQNFVDISSVKYKLFEGKTILHDEIKGLNEISMLKNTQFIYNNETIEYDPQQVPFKYSAVSKETNIIKILMDTIKNIEK